MKRLRDTQRTACCYSRGYHMNDKTTSRDQREASGMKEEQMKERRPIGGFIIAGASLALLFGIVILKARVR